ncbi:hypothetical protein [Pseudaminobacter salicylatoxidans]|uniref:hypothetical protein n=1 Tax=Pseudaminobacter salicylatoxidans TaxID=93369 RepID=UPI0002F58E97|nr:hypothetical protein [Pseudaminobacter salicylatoxidans]
MRYGIVAKTVLLCGSLLYSGWAYADDPMVLFDHNDFVLRTHLQAGLNVVSEHNLFWNYADTFAPSSAFDPNAIWLDGYVKPGVSFTKSLGRVTLYGKISAVASGTLGIDAYFTGNIGSTTLEESYLGLRSQSEIRSPSFDVSLGPREFNAGTGMLLANGGSSGFERGALKFGPRKAWEQAAIGRLGFASAFYLDANERSNSDTSTVIVGADFRYQMDEIHSRVLHSAMSRNPLLRTRRPRPSVSACRASCQGDVPV